MRWRNGRGGKGGGVATGSVYHVAVSDPLPQGQTVSECKAFLGTEPDTAGDNGVGSKNFDELSSDVSANSLSTAQRGDQKCPV